MSVLSPVNVDRKCMCTRTKSQFILILVHFKNMQFKQPSLIESRCEDLSSGFATRVDLNRPAQLQKLCRGLKFRI